MPEAEDLENLRCSLERQVVTFASPSLVPPPQTIRLTDPDGQYEYRVWNSGNSQDAPASVPYVRISSPSPTQMVWNGRPLGFSNVFPRAAVCPMLFRSLLTRGRRPNQK